MDYQALSVIATAVASIVGAVCWTIRHRRTQARLAARDLQDRDLLMEHPSPDLAYGLAAMRDAEHRFRRRPTPSPSVSVPTPVEQPAIEQRQKVSGFD